MPRFPAAKNLVKNHKAAIRGFLALVQDRNAHTQPASHPTWKALVPLMFYAEIGPFRQWDIEYVDAEQSRKTVKKRLASQRAERWRWRTRTVDSTSGATKLQENRRRRWWWSVVFQVVDVRICRFLSGFSSKALGLVPARGRYGRLVSLFLGGRDASRKESTWIVVTDATCCIFTNIIVL
jgi:hypothetical protein